MVEFNDCLDIIKKKACYLEEMGYTIIDVDSAGIDYEKGDIIIMAYFEPFTDGNKRSGAFAFICFLALLLWKFSQKNVPNISSLFCPPPYA